MVKVKGVLWGENRKKIHSCKIISKNILIRTHQTIAPRRVRPLRVNCYNKRTVGHARSNLWKSEIIAVIADKVRKYGLLGHYQTALGRVGLLNS